MSLDRCRQLPYRALIPNKYKILRRFCGTNRGLCGRDTLIRVPITNPQQIQNPIQPQRRNRLLGRLLHDRLGPKRDSQSRNAQHRQIVGAVAHRQRIQPVETGGLTQFDQGREFGLAADDRLRGRA